MNLPGNELNKEKIVNFYDNFKNHQKKLGINIRHRTILKKLKKCGLKRDSKVLEIGCGIGTVSHLILKSIDRGKFVGVDISPQSIEMAKKFNSKFQQSKFVVSDMRDFSSDLKFDFIVLPDVLEHIPIDQHADLFQTISRVSTENAIIVINIPEPYTLDWTRRNAPEKLQILDQSLSALDLCNHAYAVGYYLYSLTPYGLQFKHEEYLSIVFKKVRNREFVIRNSKMKLFIDNLISKIW